jgi:MscS family membrane protein
MDEKSTARRKVFHATPTIPKAADRFAPGRGKFPFRILAALLAAWVLPFPARAEKPAAPSIPGFQKNAEKPAEAAPSDALGRSTPFGTVLGFIKAVEGGDLDRASDYLDAQLIPKRARKLAQELAAVIDAADLQDLARVPEGDTEDGLPPGRERIGTVKTASGVREIFLERVQRGKEPPIWLFSSDTLQWVPRVRGDIAVGPIERYLSGTVLDTRVLGFPLWRLIGVVLALPASFVIARLAAGLLLPLVPPLFRRLTKRSVDYPAERLKWPVSLLFMALVFYGISRFAFSAVSRFFWGYVAATVATIAGTWIGLRIIDDAAAMIGSGARPRLGSGGIAMARLLARVSKGLVVLTGAVILLYLAGVNLAAVLAGVGIGGIAVALAAQKSLENFFGAMTIISDKAICVGDFCRVGEFQGTVEDIGMRSTRIRTVERTLVSVPNGQLITMSLENYSRREKILFRQRIRLEYGTSAEQLRSILSEIRAMLAGHPKVDAEAARANLSAFGDLAFEVEVFAYVLETSYAAFLVVQEELLLRIMEIVQAGGARFAIPLPARFPARDRGGAP